MTRAAAVMEDLMMGEWTRWAELRPPNDPGSYRFRATAEILGMTLSPEWTEKMLLCGMGCGPKEYWPLSPCAWDGHRRYMTADVEWRPTSEEDASGVMWGGLDMMPCPFTGRPPVITYLGRYIGAPPWHAESFTLTSGFIRTHGWTSAKALQDAWNCRAALGERT